MTAGRQGAAPISVHEVERTTRNAVLILIAGTTLLRLAFAGSLGLGVDEIYTVATSRQLQLGYFDHPPLAWWMTWMMRFATGSEGALIVRLPFIAAFALTTWLTYSLTRLLYGLRAGFWAAVAVNIPPVIAWTSGTWVLPDGPLYVGLLAGAYAVARVLFVPRQSPLWWLVAGAAGGIAMLSKLHGVFLFAGVFVFLLTSSRHRGWLASPWPYAGVLLGLLVFSPALIWNAQHDWISITFQAGRGEVRRFSLVALLGVLGGQMAYLLPLVWLTLVIIWLRALRRGASNTRDWLLVCLATGPIVVFTLTGLTAQRVLPHWSMPGYLMLMPLLGREISRGLVLSRRWVKPWLALCIGTTALVLAVVMTLAFVRWPAIDLPNGRRLDDPLKETTDWSDLRRQMQERGLLDADKLVVVSVRWHEAGRLDVALQNRVPVICMSNDPRGYGVNKRSADYVGRDAIIIGEYLVQSEVNANLGRYFQSIEPLPPFVLSTGARTPVTLQAFLGRGLHAAPGAPDLLNPLGLGKRR